MSVAATYAPNRYHRVQMNTVSLNNAHTKALVGASLKVIRYIVSFLERQQILPVVQVRCC